MASQTATKVLKKEYLEYKKDHVQFVKDEKQLCSFCVN